MHRVPVGCARFAARRIPKSQIILEEKYLAKIVVVEIFNLHLRFEKARFMFSVGARVD